MRKNYNDYIREYNHQNYELFTLKLNKKYQKSKIIYDYLMNLKGKERNKFIKDLILKDIKNKEKNMNNKENEQKMNSNNYDDEERYKFVRAKIEEDILLYGDDDLKDYMKEELKEDLVDEDC